MTAGCGASIACHHYSGPHLPPYGVRAAAEFLGSTLSLRLVDRVEDEELRERLAAQAVLAKIVAAMRNPAEHVRDALLGAPDMLDLVDGRRRRDQRRGFARDTWPRARRAGAGRDRRLVAHAGLRAVVDDRLPERGRGHRRRSRTGQRAAGLMLRDGQYAIWFRGEAQRNVDWGGDPHQQGARRARGSTRCG